jgi:hypothetical protein
MNISEPQGHASGDIVKTIPHIYIIEQPNGTFTVDAGSALLAGSYSEEEAKAVAKQHIKDHGFIYPNGAEIKFKLHKEAR